MTSRSEFVVFDLYRVQTANFTLSAKNNRWPIGLFERVNQRITRQIETVEDMTGDMDPKTNFALIVIQTELERYKYLVRSFLRSRIAKVSWSLSRAVAFLRCSSIASRPAGAARLDYYKPKSGGPPPNANRHSNSQGQPS